LYVDVFGIDGVNKTSHIYKEGIKPGRRITTNNGYELGGSMIHPVIVIDESGNVVFKEVSDLTTDDYVAIQYDQNYFSNTNKEIHFDFTKKTHDNHSIEYKSPKEINEDLSYYLGLLLGDGCLTTDRTITFTNADKQLVKRFFDLSASIFGIVPKYNTDKYGYYYSSRFIYDFINNGCGVKMVKSTDKEIPSIILESTKECVKKFIIGLMDTDGYFEKGSGAIGITLSSKKLINQLQTVLLNFGVVSSVRHRLVKYNGGFNDAWVLKINGSYVKRYFKEIGFSLNNKKNMENTVLYKTNNTNIDTIPNIHNSLYELVSTYKLDRSFHSNYRGYYKGYRKPSRKKLTEILNVLYEKVGSKIKDNTIYVNLLSLAKENIFWSKIAKIDYVSEMDLYDFTVPVTHTFTSNGFISHNTLTTKVLADELIKDRNNLVTIDCSEYSADHEYAKLIGAPSGYIGHEQGGYLTNAVNENPFSIVVFDEIEKASSKVHELMLQILEEGRLTDGKGQKVSFKDTIVIMTSNIGVSEIEDVRKTIGFGDVSKLTEDKKTKAIDGAIKKKFKPEFLNRIDSVVHFCSLNKNDYMRIIEIELYKLNENLRNNDTDFKDLRVDFDKKVKSFIYKHGIDEEFGARPLKRCIEKEISTPLATRLLRGDIPCNSDIMITIKRGKPDFEIIEKETTDLLENRSLFKSV
jgi:intein/homing endonuclease